MDPPSASERVRLHVLGEFELRVGGEQVPLPRTAQRLLVFLAIRDRPVQRSTVAGTLWPDAGDEEARTCARAALSRLRRRGVEPVRAVGSQMSLAPGIVLDLREAQAVAHRALRSDERPTTPPRRDEDLRDLDRGSSSRGVAPPDRLLEADLLPDWDEDWLVVERERFRSLRLHALETVAARLTDQGSFGEAAEAALMAIAADPLRETAHRALIRVFLAEGNQADAVRHLESFTSQLREELGIEPSFDLRGQSATA